MATESFWKRRWRRLDAQHWIWVLGVLQTTGLALVTAGTLLVGAVLVGLLHAALAAVIPGALTVLVGWLTAAWRREEPWSWVAWTVVSCVGVLWPLTDAAGGTGSWGDGLALGLAAGTLVLLLHPDSRARLARPAPRQPDTVGGRRAP